MARYLHKFILSIDRMRIEEEGATTTEYAVILGIILVAVIAGVAFFGMHLSDTTSAMSGGLNQGGDPFGGAFGPGKIRLQSTVSHP